MTTPEEVDRMLAEDREVVGLLADLVEQRRGGPKVKPTPKPTTSTKPPPTKPATTSRKAAPMRRRTKAKPPPPKHRGVSIRAVDDPPPALSPTERFEQAQAMEPRRLRTSAHEVAEATPCNVCGGGVEAANAERVGPWRRHRDCARLGGSSRTRVPAAARALGLGEVAADVAAMVAFRVPRYADEHPEPTWLDSDRQRDRGAWLHVDRKRLLAAVSEAVTERDELTIPRPCADGRCAWCGVEEALDWRAYGHRWTDGSDAPLCASCGDVYERRGAPSPAFFDDQRAALAEAMSGVPPMMDETAPPGLIGYAEADSEGDGQPWSHLPSEAVEAFRMASWGRFQGRYAPPEHRAEAVARAQAAEAQRAARSAEARAEEQRREDLHGFGGVLADE